MLINSLQNASPNVNLSFRNANMAKRVIVQAADSFTPAQIGGLRQVANEISEGIAKETARQKGKVLVCQNLGSLSDIYFKK